MAPNNALAKSELGEVASDRTETEASVAATVTGEPPSKKIRVSSSEASAGTAGPMSSTAPVVVAGGDHKFDVTPEWLASQTEQIARPRDGMITSEEVQARGDGVEKGVAPPSGIGMDELKRFLTVVMFLTRLPVPRWCDHNPRFLVPGMMWFPVVGAGVGFWAGVWFDGCVHLLGAHVAACASTMASVWLTGCFHEDGLADTLDAFGGGWTRDQILRIMKDSRVGTYAVVGVTLVLMAKISLLYRIHEQSNVSVAVALLVAHVVGRTCAVVMCASCAFVHDEGDDKGLLYNTFGGCLELGLLTPIRTLISVFAAVTLVGCLLPFDRAAIVISISSTMAVSAGKYSTSVLGGIIGDFLGASIVLIELAVYACIAADIDIFKLPNTSAIFALLRLGIVASIVAMILAGPAGWLARTKKEC